jgi:DmsE family decaheme c-type cytochrome
MIANLLRLAGGAARAAVCSGLLLAASAGAQPATTVGEQACLRCHGQENRHFTATAHAKAFRLNPANDRERLVCETCHGPGSRHVDKPTDRSTIIGFTKGWDTPLDVQNAQCLACHQGGNRLFWPGSRHADSRLGCADCHNPMERLSLSGLQARSTINETCFTCHQQQRHEFNKRSHMPLLEGKMSCADCHNPHGTRTAPLLKAESVNVVCYACHAEKRGPFLWEHAPVHENCLGCHQPHGSNHDKLLVSARPQLCQQCHSPSVGHPGQFYRGDQTAAAAQVGGTASQRVIGRSCQNCHSAIHGSNHPAGARLQR